MVTTHDLALTEFAGGDDSRITNVHFEDHLVDGKMIFDYRMPGVVQHSNALALMRASGWRCKVAVPRAKLSLLLRDWITSVVILREAL